jgi:Na+/H+-dicarboxylate symporter
VEEAEATMKDNLWVSLIAALGLGVLAGLVMGLTRGR